MPHSEIRSDRSDPIGGGGGPGFPPRMFQPYGWPASCRVGCPKDVPVDAREQAAVSSQTIELSTEIIWDLLKSQMPKPLCDPTRLDICGLRGAQKVSATSVRLVENLPNRYNDSIVLFGRKLLVFEASVDPGQRYTEQPIEGTGGCAHLMDGRWEYRRGRHLGAHDALVEHKSVSIWRDWNKNYERDTDPKSKSYDKRETEVYRGMGFGIHIHAGGPEEAVGPHSAGCQVIRGGWDGVQWQTFWREVKASPQQVFFYYLLNGHMLGKVTPVIPSDSSSAFA
jgi:hypothetical protein